MFETPYISFELSISMLDAKDSPISEKFLNMLCTVDLGGDFIRSAQYFSRPSRAPGEYVPDENASTLQVQSKSKANNNKPERIYTK